MEERQKALLIPVNPENQMLIQDRRGYKKPDWGFFGGGIEKDETSLEAVIRESKEELSLDIQEEDLEYVGVSHSMRGEQSVTRHYYIYRTEQKTFLDLEGKGAYWLSFSEAMDRMEIRDMSEGLIQKIGTILSTDEKK